MKVERVGKCKQCHFRFSPITAKNRNDQSPQRQVEIILKCKQCHFRFRQKIFSTHNLYEQKTRIITVTWKWKPASLSIMAILGEDNTSHFDAHFLKLLEHKMKRPYTFTDGCQLKKQKISAASAIYTFTFIYLK